MMKKISLIFILSLILHSVLALELSQVPWRITYSKYRLFYVLSTTENLTDVNVYFQVPHTILDDVVKYCQDHNYSFCDIAYPRLYLIDEINISAKGWWGNSGTTCIDSDVVDINNPPDYTTSEWHNWDSYVQGRNLHFKIELNYSGDAIVQLAVSGYRMAGFSVWVNGNLSYVIDWYDGDGDICSDGYYNGQKVTTVDITNHLKPGNNIIYIWCSGDGSGKCYAYLRIYPKELGQTFDTIYVKDWIYPAKTFISQKQLDPVYYSWYNSTPDSFYVNFADVPAGTYYFVVYYPYYFWEDFEDNALGAEIINSGDCFGDGWCFYSRETSDTDSNDQWYAKIQTGGWDPTPNKRIYLYVKELDNAGWFIIYRDVNVTISTQQPLYVEWYTSAGMSNSQQYEASLIFQFKLKDGSTVSLKYRIYGTTDYRNFLTDICGLVSLSTGYKKRDLMSDLISTCGVSPNEVESLWRVYLLLYTYAPGLSNVYMQVDNIKITPGDITNYFP